MLLTNEVLLSILLTHLVILLLLGHLLRLTRPYIANLMLIFLFWGHEIVANLYWQIVVVIAGPIKVDNLNLFRKEIV